MANLPFVSYSFLNSAEKALIACTDGAHIAVAHIVVAYIEVAYIEVAHIVVAYIEVAYIKKLPISIMHKLIP